MDAKRAVRAVLLSFAAVLLPSAGCEGGDVGEGDELTQVTVRASVPPDGLEPAGPSSHPSLTADGRILVFASAASNLTASDSNGYQDIFLKDRLTGRIENLTRYVVPDAFADYMPYHCYDPVITPDGRYVAFRTRGNYDPMPSIGGVPDLKAWTCVFRYDRVTREFKAGFPKDVDPDADLMDPSISSDGRFIVFTSSATNLPPADAGGSAQVWVHDLGTGTTRLVSHSTAGPGTPCESSCRWASISGDGRYAVFESRATDLTGQNTNGELQVYRARLDVDPITIEAVAFNSAGQFTDCDSGSPAISGDGRHVAFYTFADNIVTGVLKPYIVRRDMNLGGLTELVTDRPGILLESALPTPPNYVPLTLSGDGRSVAFMSNSSDLYPGLDMHFHQVFVRDMEGGITLVSRHQDGTFSDLECSNMALSYDGSWVAWETASSFLVDGDTNGLSDIFLRGPLR